MNTPTPPTPAPSGNAVTASMPTLGSLIGSAGGAAAVGALHVADPVLGGALVSLITALSTALFHFLGSKIGINLS